jgi:hypothetical protein
MFNYYSKIGFLNFLPRNGADDVKISDLWEDFFFGFILNSSHWGSFVGMGFRPLEQKIWRTWRANIYANLYLYL